MALIIHEVKKGHWPGGMWLFMHLSWGSDAMDLAQRGTKGGCCCCCIVCPQETTHGSGRSQKRYQAQTKQQLLVLCSQAFLLTYLLSPPA